MPGCHAGWILLAWCAGVATLQPRAAAQTAAQAPPSSRQELMRKWDIDRDGKVDASEAEIARSRMRRSRNDAVMNSGTDPVTGRPRGATDPATGRPLSPDAAAAERGGSSRAADDDGLILVPGNGERPRGLGDTAGDGMLPRPAPRDREALPGTRAPSLSPTVPSVTPRVSTGMPRVSTGTPPVSTGTPTPDLRARLPAASSAAGRQGPPGPRDAAGGDLGGRSRLMPGASPAPNAGARGLQAPNADQDRQQPGGRPGIIAGGVRAGAPGARPGYGAGGVPPDLNAGRPSGQPPMMQRPGIGPYRGPTPPGAPAVGTPSLPRPGMGQTDGGRSPSRTPNTAPRVPRMSTDEFYGR